MNRYDGHFRLSSAKRSEWKSTADIDLGFVFARVVDGKLVIKMINYFEQGNAKSINLVSICTFVP